MSAPSTTSQDSGSSRQSPISDQTSIPDNTPDHTDSDVSDDQPEEEVEEEEEVSEIEEPPEAPGYYKWLLTSFYLDHLTELDHRWPGQMTTADLVRNLRIWIPIYKKVSQEWLVEGKLPWRERWEIRDLRCRIGDAKAYLRMLIPETFECQVLDDIWDLLDEDQFEEDDRRFQFDADYEFRYRRYPVPDDERSVQQESMSGDEDTEDTEDAVSDAVSEKAPTYIYIYESGKRHKSSAETTVSNPLGDGDQGIQFGPDTWLQTFLDHINNKATRTNPVEALNITISEWQQRTQSFPGPSPAMSQNVGPEAAYKLAGAGDDPTEGPADRRLSGRFKGQERQTYKPQTSKQFLAGENPNEAKNPRPSLSDTFMAQSGSFSPNPKHKCNVCYCEKLLGNFDFASKYPDTCRRCRINKGIIEEEPSGPADSNKKVKLGNTKKRSLSSNEKRRRSYSEDSDDEYLPSPEELLRRHKKKKTSPKETDTAVVNPLVEKTTLEQPAPVPFGNMMAPVARMTATVTAPMTAFVLNSAHLRSETRKVLEQDVASLTGQKDGIASQIASLEGEENQLLEQLTHLQARIQHLKSDNASILAKLSEYNDHLGAIADADKADGSHAGNKSH